MERFLNKKIVVLLLILLSTTVFLYLQNNWIVVSNYNIYSKNLPESFDGYRIVQISDLHNKEFSREQSKLVSKVINSNPDIVVITGDLIDSSKYDESPSLSLIEELVDIYPIYFVNGNHESRREEYPEFESKLVELGVIVLSNKSEYISNGIEEILIAGIDDPCFTECIFNGMPDDYLGDGNEHYSILLEHRPELFETYASYGIDLTFSGHAHGGQVRLPFIGGIVAPDQGLLPEYTKGVYDIDNSNMVVSRGLGNSVIPLWVFNRPELVVVTLNNTQ